MELNEETEDKSVKVVLTDTRNPRKVKGKVDGKKTIFHLESSELEEDMGSGYGQGVGYYYSEDFPKHTFEFNVDLSRFGQDHEVVDVNGVERVTVD